jgi:molybdopterin-guanine dinucleotide biosynthesis protein A
MRAVILAGGKGSRMGGIDKALIKIEGKAIIERIVETIRYVVHNILIVSDNDYSFKGVNVTMVRDIEKDKGPMMGIYSGLISSKTEWNFACGCDMPYLTTSIILTLIENIRECEAVVPLVDGKREPLCALYSKRVIKRLQDAIRGDILKVSDFLSNVNVEYVGDDLLRKTDLECNPFFNINYEADIIKK